MNRLSKSPKMFTWHQSHRNCKVYVYFASRSRVKILKVTIYSLSFFVECLNFFHLLLYLYLFILFLYFISLQQDLSGSTSPFLVSHSTWFVFAFLSRGIVDVQFRKADFNSVFFSGKKSRELQSEVQDSLWQRRVSGHSGLRWSYIYTTSDIYLRVKIHQFLSK